MVDESVEGFLNNRRTTKAGNAVETDAGGQPLLQMKKYVIPKAKSATSESTELTASQEH